VDLETGGSISELIGEEPFPGKLTKEQKETVLEAAA